MAKKHSGHQKPPHDEEMDSETESGNEESVRGLGLGVGDLLKKVVVTGASAVFLTEDAIRSLSKEIKLPKELIGGILSSAKSTKEDLVNKISDEFSKQLRKIDLTAEVSRFLESHDVDLQIKVRFQKKNQESKTE